LEIFRVSSKSKACDLGLVRARAICGAGGWALFEEASQKKQEQSD